MNSATVSCVVLSFFLLRGARGYVIPDVSIEVLNPKGLRASIPDAPKVALFVFQGNINRGINNNDVGAISGEVVESTNGRWVFEDSTVQLKSDDVINYYVFVSVDGVGFLKDGLSYRISGTDIDKGGVKPTPNPNPDSGTVTKPPPPADCRPSLTRVRGGIACAEQTIFEDNFDQLDEYTWQVEQYIPIHHPEFPFVSYQYSLLIDLKMAPIVSVANGMLRISPKLQQDQPGFTNESIYSGTLDLFSGCTGSANECSMQAFGASILPPIASGKLSSKGFAFTYGTVHIRAKLPLGDWLYPEILLESFLKKYGNLNYASGVVKIAAARGNRQLNVGVTDYSNKVLYGGPVMDFECRRYLVQKRLSHKMWGKDFHIYSVNWTPDHIGLLVDGEEWVRVEPLAGGLLNHFPSSCHLPRYLLGSGTKLAPFDDYFYLLLGVSAGGITEFPDGVLSSGGHAKPWTNQGRKASLSFWQDMDSWYHSWDNPELLVDYVKVVAL